MRKDDGRWKASDRRESEAGNRGGQVMEEMTGMGMGARRNEDIALDLMKFIAMTTGYGKTGQPGAGFQGGAIAKPEDLASHLLELYERCLAVVQGKK